MVRSAQGGPAISSGISSLIGLGGASAQSKGDTMSVVDFLNSIDAVIELDHDLGLVERFRRPESDIVSRLSSSTPAPESLLKYYRQHVTATFDSDTGIIALKVTTFRPTDSFQIANALLKMGEIRVNLLNKQSYSDALSTASRQLDEAERALRAVQVRLTQYRQSNSDIDPEGSGRAQVNMVAQLTAGLAQARAQLQSMSGIIDPNSPQYVAMRSRVSALESQVALQRGKLTGSNESIASNLGGYEDLRVRQEFASKRYEAAAASYEVAREDARKKQLYLVRVVNPNMPQKSLFPERGRITLTIFFSLLIAYGIGWLIVAGVREHSNV
jgi:capsular polysaccharide transport system permease protein